MERAAIYNTLRSASRQASGGYESRIKALPYEHRE